MTTINTFIILESLNNNIDDAVAFYTSNIVQSFHRGL